MPISNNLSQGGKFNWNPHWELNNKHAFLAPSNKAWLNYDPKKLKTVWNNNKKKEEGTRLHEYASQAIMLKQKQARSKQAVAQFVNDAIGYGMYSEVLLSYSNNCFGTTDAILFKKTKENPNGLLRIHDLKTGSNPAHFDQLDTYAALFLLEYGMELNITPETIDIELRIYQGTEVFVRIPEPADIRYVMEKIIELDIAVTEADNAYRNR